MIQFLHSMRLSRYSPRRRIPLDVQIEIVYNRRDLEYLHCSPEYRPIMNWSWVTQKVRYDI